MTPIEIQLTEDQKRQLQPLIEQIETIVRANEETTESEIKEGVIGMAQFSVPDLKNGLSEPVMKVFCLTGYEAFVASDTVQECIDGEMEKEASAKRRIPTN